jgi:hypothetical protein
MKHYFLYTYVCLDPNPEKCRNSYARYRFAIGILLYAAEKCVYQT